jgi:hypothetical protein
LKFGRHRVDARMQGREQTGTVHGNRG